MKKTKITAILLLLLPLFINSCKDDPVTSTEDFAPARFNWRTIDINNNNNPGFADIWALDTNNIYLLNHYDKSLYIVSHGFVTTHYIGHYYLTQIKGLSNNEVYLFGAEYGSSILTIIKWNGGSFEYYPTDIIVTGLAVTIKGCPISTNEIWILSQNGISKFDGVNMTDYPYDEPNDILIPLDFFLSNNHKVQYIGVNRDTNNEQNRLYEFRDTGFVKIYEGTNNPSGRTLLMLKEVGGISFGLQLNQPLGEPYSVCVKYFTGSSFMDYFCYNDKIRTKWWTGISNNPVGSNLQSFIFLAQASEFIFNTILPPQLQVNVGILHWDGIQVSKEIGLQSFESPYPFQNFILFTIKHDNYLILEPYQGIPSVSILYIGTKK